MKKLVLFFVITFACLQAQTQELVVVMKHSGATGTPAFVQGTTSNGTTTVTLTGVTSGHVIYTYIFDGSGPGNTDTFTDNQGNTWTTVKSVSLSVDGDTTALGCAIAGSSGTLTITAKANGVGGPFEYAVYEVSNSSCTVDTSNSFDQTGNSGSCPDNGITTTVAKDFVFAACGSEHSSNTFSVGSGFSNLQQVGGNNLATELQVPTGTGTFNGGLTYTGVTGENAAMIVAFQP